MCVLNCLVVDSLVYLMILYRLQHGLQAQSVLLTSQHVSDELCSGTNNESDQRGQHSFRSCLKIKLAATYSTWKQLRQTVQTLLLGLLSLCGATLWPWLSRQRAAWPNSFLQHLEVNHPAGGTGKVGNPDIQPSETESEV